MSATLVRFVPAFLGIVVVLQAGLNRRISNTWGLPATVLLNALGFLVLSVALYFFSQNAGETLPEPFRNRFDLKFFSLWFLLPGLCGFLLVVGGPWSIARLGAAQTFTLLISAQLAASLAWDYFVEGVAISPLRGVGVIVAWIGVLLAVRG